MVVLVYLRCNSDHYFTGTSICPFDGWSAAGFEQAVLAVTAIADRGERPSIEALRQQGVPKQVVERAAVIEFLSDSVVFEALDPAGYIIEGEWVPMARAGPEHK
jgi:hypothetical protein